MVAETIISASPAMTTAMRLVRQFAPTLQPVLLVGATGTGKELLAREVHRLSGRRGPLIDLNCATLPRDLVESELFGHGRGAFTGATHETTGLVLAARGGTLFLDELSSLVVEAQAKLLRVLEDQEVRRVGETAKRPADFRLVAAVQEDIYQRVGTTFRADLYHRVAGVVIDLPPLTARSEEIVPLARHFAAAAGRRLDRSAEVILRGYHWPGNVRELRAAVERAVVICGGDTLDRAAVAQAIDLGGRKGTLRPADSDLCLAEEGRALRALCEQCGWQARRLAEALGVAPATIYRRLKVAGISLRHHRQRIGFLTASRDEARKPENSHLVPIDSNLVTLVR